MKLTEEEIERYDRHIKLPGFGLEKQLKLKEAKILLVGAGGLGCPIALYLAASGVGTVAIADNDTVELSNLQRQIAFGVSEIGEFKATALADRVAKLNPLIKVFALTIKIDATNVESIISHFDLVIDGTDNFATRFLIADACYINKIDYMHASIYQYQGQISLFKAGEAACFRCLYRQPPGSDALAACGEAGILGVVAGSLGLMAATEAIKYLAGLDNSIVGKVLVYDVIKQELKKFDLEQDSECPLCGKAASIVKIEESFSPCEKIEKTNNAIERFEANELVISQEQALKLILQKDADKKIRLLDVREEHEFAQGHLDNAILLPLSVLQSIPATLLETPLETKFNFDNGDKDRLILCYCQRGTRSLKAASILREAGFANTFSLEGGFEAWHIVNQTYSATLLR